MGSPLVFSLVIVLDAAAFVLAVVAEKRRSTATVVPDPEKLYDHCVYDSDISTELGISSCVLLLASQILIMTVTKCLCCGRALGHCEARKCAKILFFVSWLTFITAEACLIAGSVRNAYHTRFRGAFQMEPLNCETVRKGIFAAGAGLTFITAISTILYYHCYSKAYLGSTAAYREASIDMEAFPH